MAEEYSGNFSTNEVESTEFVFDKTTENNAGEFDTLDKIALVAGGHEIDAHDEQLSTIPEETESVAGSKVDDVEHKEALEINVHQEETWQDESTAAATIEDADIPISKEPLASVIEHPAPVYKDLEDTSSDHTTYIEQYRNLMLEMTVAKHRNMLLQKKVMEHLKRRKLESISKTEDVTDLDLEMKYLKQLQEFKQLKEELNAEEQQRDNEIEELKKEKHALDESVQENLNELMTYINQTAEKLQFGKTANKLTQKEVVERMTSRLASKMGEFSKLQLEHMKLRNGVATQQERKKELEVAGEVLNLANYEQLRTENHNLVVKVQERDEELQRLREKAMTSVHNLAHIRQKAWATEEAVKEKSHQLQALEEQFAKMREEMTAMKKRRDSYHKETQRLRQAAGLLMEPALLRDHEQSMEEVTRLSAELQNLPIRFQGHHTLLSPPSAATPAHQEPPAVAVPTIATHGNNRAPPAATPQPVSPQHRPADQAPVGYCSHTVAGTARN